MDLTDIQRRRKVIPLFIFDIRKFDYPLRVNICTGIYFMMFQNNYGLMIKLSFKTTNTCFEAALFMYIKMFSGEKHLHGEQG